MFFLWLIYCRGCSEELCKHIFPPISSQTWAILVEIQWLSQTFLCIHNKSSSTIRKEGILYMRLARVLEFSVLKLYILEIRTWILAIVTTILMYYSYSLSKAVGYFCDPSKVSTLTIWVVNMLLLHNKNVFQAITSFEDVCTLCSYYRRCALCTVCTQLIEY
jgi:hypothetical protein